MKLLIRIEYEVTQEQAVLWAHHGGIGQMDDESIGRFLHGAPVHVLINPDTNGGFGGKAIHELRKSDADETPFDFFWKTWTMCPRCSMSEPARLAASNAWYRQQSVILAFGE